MRGKLRATMYIFDQPFQEYNARKFMLVLFTSFFLFAILYRTLRIQDFFKDPTVLSSLKVFTKSGEWKALDQSVHDVRIDPLTTHVLSLDFFDRLFDNKVVRESGGHIRKCIEEYKDEFIVSDELRKVVPSSTSGDPAFVSSRC